MELASVIISVIALLLSMASLVWQLAKHFSSHTIQYVPAPMPQDEIGGGISKDPMKEFREIGAPLEEDELQYMEEMKLKKLRKA